MRTATALAPVSNDGEQTIRFSDPYTATVVLQGVAPILFHRWSNEAVEAKSKAAKNSRAKKEDNVESYVYRDAGGVLAIPTEYLRQSLIGAAKFLQDPRSPRKSAMDLFEAGVACNSDLCSLGCKEWDYLDKRRAIVQRNAITRVRPAMLAGWEITASLLVLLPEYIDPPLLQHTLTNAGRLIGLGDFRPTFGRFQILRFDTSLPTSSG